MKPHEETLEVSPFDSRAVVRKGLDGDVVADVRVPLNDGGQEWSELFAAAPEMARALMVMLEAFPLAAASEEECVARTAARAALKKAGVLP